jgi:hypothetical protein
VTREQPFPQALADTVRPSGMRSRLPRGFWVQAVLASFEIEADNGKAAKTRRNLNRLEVTKEQKEGDLDIPRRKMARTAPRALGRDYFLVLAARTREPHLLG